MPLTTKTIQLVGLPGSGKTRIANSLNQQFGMDVLSASDLVVGKKGVIDFSFSNLQIAIDERWCVIDIRSPLEPTWAQEWLAAVLQNVDGVVFSFAEQAELQTQAWWQKWLKEQAEKHGMPNWPVVRWFYQAFPDGFSGFKELAATAETEKGAYTANKQAFNSPQSFAFKVKTVVLDHLLMGLDNSLRNLEMKIVRVEGLVKAFEYENLIELQGTVNRLDKFGLDLHSPVNSEDVGTIKISGFDLDEKWLAQIIKASEL